MKKVTKTQIEKEVNQDPWEVFDFCDYEMYYDMVQEEIVNDYCNQIGKMV